MWTPRRSRSSPARWTSGQFVDALTGLASGLLGLLSSLFFVVTLVLFMVIDGSGFTAKLQRLPQERRHLADALADFARGTRTYLVVSTVFGLIVAVIDTVALLWIGVPVAMLWGLLAFITNYIPNVGFVVGVIPPAVIGLLEGGVGMMVTVIVVYSLINLVIQSVIQPRVVGEAVGLSPTHHHAVAGVLGLHPRRGRRPDGRPAVAAGQGRPRRRRPPRRLGLAAALGQRARQAAKEPKQPKRSKHDSAPPAA